MKCSSKTMLKIGIAIAIPLAVGFIAFPQFRVIIISLAPFALLAICPISMIFCMKGMMKDKNHTDRCASCGHKHEEQSSKI